MSTKTNYSSEGKGSYCKCSVNAQKSLLKKVFSSFFVRKCFVVNDLKLCNTPVSAKLIGTEGEDKRAMGDENLRRQGREKGQKSRWVFVCAREKGQVLSCCDHLFCWWTLCHHSIGRLIILGGGRGTYTLEYFNCRNQLLPSEGLFMRHINEKVVLCISNNFYW